jgi:hypothetical protein
MSTWLKYKSFPQILNNSTLITSSEYFVWTIPCLQEKKYHQNKHHLVQHDLYVWNLPEGMRSCQDVTDDEMNRHFCHLKINMQNQYLTTTLFSLKTWISEPYKRTELCGRVLFQSTVSHWFETKCQHLHTTDTLPNCLCILIIICLCCNKGFTPLDVLRII